MENNYLKHRQRMVDDFLINPHNFQKYEIIEILLMFAINQRDMKPLAKDLINKWGSINGIFHAPQDALLKIHGLGPKTIVFFQCIKKITQILLMEQITPKDTLTMTIEKIASYSMFILGNLSYEQVMVFIFDNQRRLIKETIHSKGNMSASPIYFKELLVEILNTKGMFIVLVHNHPSGNPYPSQEDIEITKKLYNILNSLELCLFDHLIIGNNNYVSLKKLGFF